MQVFMLIIRKYIYYNDNTLDIDSFIDYKFLLWEFALECLFVGMQSNQEFKEYMKRNFNV